jgi:cell division protein FtsL
MNNKTLLFCIALLNIGMIILLVHKQNKIIKAQYELQQLAKQKDELQQQKKELVFMLEKQQQLSSVQNFAKNKLAMTPIKLKEALNLVVA